MRLQDASTWLECLTSGRVTVLKPSLNLFGDFLEISAARGKAFVLQDAEREAEAARPVEAASRLPIGSPVGPMRQRLAA